MCAATEGGGWVDFEFYDVRCFLKKAKTDSCKGLNMTFEPWGTGASPKTGYLA